MTVSCSHKARKLGIERITVIACQSSDNWSFLDQFHVLFFSVTSFIFRTPHFPSAMLLTAFFVSWAWCLHSMPSAELFVTLCKKLLQNKKNSYRKSDSESRSQ